MPERQVQEIGLVQRRCTATGYAHHAYTTAAGPLYKPPEARQRDDRRAVAPVARSTCGRPRARDPRGLPIYLTEFGVQSKPNRYLGVSLAKQAEFDAIAEKIAWSNPRVAAFSQYLLVDDPLGGKPGSSVNGGTVGFQTGLEYLGGKPKPLYFGWPVPLTVSKSGHGYSLWGLVRPTTGCDEGDGARPAQRRSRKYTTLKTVTTNSLGYWTLALLHTGHGLARALGEPDRCQVRRPADQPRIEANG